MGQRKTTLVGDWRMQRTYYNFQCLLVFMDSFEETLRKSQEAGERLKQALQKGTGEKTVQNTTLLIQKTESKLEQSKESIAEMDKLYKNIQKSMELSVDTAVESVQAAVTPQTVEPGFQSHCISPHELAQLLKSSKRIVFLTGSGICTGLGLPEYRHHKFNKDLAQEHEPQIEENVEIDQAILLTSVCFAFNRKAGWKWISNYEQAMQKSKPSQAHMLLDDVAEQLGREGRKVSLVTENIDNYHQEVQQSRKLSRQTYQYPILAMHGNILQIRCRHCSNEKGKLWLQPYEDYAQILKMQSRLYCPCCEGPLNPNIMFHDEFYTELYNNSDSILTAAGEADVIVVIGSSSESAITNEAISSALAQGRKVVEIGSQCSIEKVNMQWVQAPAAEILQQVKHLLSQ